MNAGGLYGEARPENFPIVNDYRNPIIAEAMKEMKYVNMFNQGIRRVQDMLLENGNKEAVFDVSKLLCLQLWMSPMMALKVALKVILKVMHLIYGLKNRLGEILKLLPKIWQELVKKDLQL